LPALYISLDLQTAWSEAQQDLARKAQPATIVCYDCRLSGVLDLTDEAVRAFWDVSWTTLACPWEYVMRVKGQMPDSQALGQRLADRPEIDAIRVPSFANGARGGVNLVLFKWDSETVAVIDDARRLPDKPGPG
jgi:RES domain-containing protein